MAVRNDESRRALVLHDQPIVVDLIELTLNHGLFAVRAATDLTQAERILAEWRPHIAVIDMDHADSASLLRRLGVAGTLAGGATPALGLTRRGDLRTKLQHGMTELAGQLDTLLMRTGGRKFRFDEEE